MERIIIVIDKKTAEVITYGNDTCLICDKTETCKDNLECLVPCG